MDKMKNRDQKTQPLSDLCKRLKSQLEELSVQTQDDTEERETERLRTLLSSLKQQISELSR